MQQSIAAMGTSVPSDSTATGTVTIAAGSSTSQGSIKILTRGSAQTLVRTATPDGTRVVTFSNGQASESVGTALTQLPLELVLSSQAPDFPLAFLAGALNDSDVSLQYVGLETASGSSQQHIRLWKTFSAGPDLQPAASFSTKDVWIDAASGLPARISYARRAAQGASPSIPVEVFFSNYQSVGGILYPSSIEKSYNGTPWATIAITKVAFNTGLSDSDFPVQ